MLTPHFDLLDSLTKTSNMPRNFYVGALMHPNPYFYKYLWRVFWAGSDVEGAAFLNSTPIATKEAWKLIDWLKSEGQPYLVYSEKRRRLGIAVWNYTSPKFRDREFAPAYDDDCDPPTLDGHK